MSDENNNNKIDAKEFKSQTIFLNSASITHWKDHIRDTLPVLQEAHQSGLETGNLEYGCYALNVYTYHSFYAGRELNELEQEVTELADIVKKLKHETSSNYSLIYIQTIQNLLGKANDPCRLIGDVYDESKMLQVHFETNDVGAILQSHINKLILCYLFGDYNQAIENAATIEKYSDGMPDTSHIPVANFFGSLTQLALFNVSSRPRKRKILKNVRANQKKMKHWADRAPMNYLHKYHLVEAELARIRDEKSEAMIHYSQAIQFAQENKFIQEEALANELAGKFYLDGNFIDLAAIYINKSYDCYDRWNALAKLKDLELKYRQLIFTSRKHKSEMKPSTSPQALDLSTIINSSQMLSKEFNVDRLLEKIMKLSIENAGAERGFLVLQSDERFLVKAASTTDQEDVMIIEKELSENNNDLSEAIVRYTIRNNENIALNDASNEGQFINDPYVINNRPRSILCIPVDYKDNILGVLYLENNLTSNAFTQDHLKVLNILMAQAAISLENARLFAEQKLTELALRESEEKWRSLAENAPNIIITIDQNSKILFINHTVPGYTIEEVTGNILYDYILPDYQDKVKETVKHVFKTGETGSYEIKGAGLHGRDSWYTGNVSPVKYDNKIVSVTLIITDITERKDYEKELKKYRDHLEVLVEERTRELEIAQAELVRKEKLATLGQLTATVSHELRNPLGTIRTAFFSLDKRIRNKVSGVDKFLERAERNIKRCDNIIDELLGFTRIRKPAFESTIIDEWLDQEIDEMNIPDYIKVKKKLMSGAQVMIDRDRFYRCLLNIIDNAWQAVVEDKKKPGPEKNAESFILTIESRKSKGKVKIVIKDTGPGIPHAKIEKIFEPLYSTKNFGVGLGLPIAKQIIEQHNGEIEIKSKEEIGTDVTLWLPMGN